MCVSGLLSLNPASGNTSPQCALFPLSCLSPALSLCLTTATASAGMSAAWRDTHIKMNSPVRHCFRCYRTTEFFVIRSSPSLPQTPSCVQSLFPFKCLTIAHFLLHTHCYGSKQRSLVPQSICIVLTLALTAKGGFLNLASALTMILRWTAKQCTQSNWWSWWATHPRNGNIGSFTHYLMHTAHKSGKQ